MDDDIPEPQDGTPFATKFFTLLHRYRKLLIRFFWIPVLTVALGVGIQWWLLRHAPPTFESTGRMIVNVKLSIPSANVYNEELDNFFGTQAALMQSDSVVQRVRARLQAANLPPSPVSLSVNPVPKTSIFNLQAMGPNAEYTQAYLQATMDEYIKLKKELLSTATTATQSVMEEELKQMALELGICKQELINYQTSNSVVLLEPNGGNSAAERLSTLNQELADKRSELQLLKTLTLDQNLERIQNIFGPTVYPSPSNAVSQPGSAWITNGTSASPGGEAATPANLGKFEEAYLTTKQELDLLRGHRDELTNNLLPTAGEIIELDKEIALHERLLVIFRTESEEQLKNRQHTLELEIQDLERQVSEWEAKALDVSKKLADYDALKENRQRLQMQYDQLEANLQTLDVNKGIGQESVTILEPASIAVHVSLQGRKYLVMAGLLGLVLAGGILLFINGLNDRPGSFAELQDLFDLPVLGQIPNIKSKNRGSAAILKLDDDRYPMKESYRSLRSAFLYKDALKGNPQSHPKSIVITSAGPNDGKSMTAANFAITLAQGGARVLLIDADLRRGVLHKHFQTAEGPGLTEVLAGECPWNSVVVQTEFPNLWLMPAGDASRYQSSNLFARSGPFLAEVADYYDFCILDTVPIMVADDVLSLAPHADALIMVVRAGFTSGRVALAALDLLRLRRINVVGLVFNAIPAGTGDYHNYQYKEYYA